MAATVSSLSTAQLGGNSPASLGVYSANAGDWLLLLLSVSNDGSGGATSYSSVSVSSAGGGTVDIVDRANILYDPGAAGAGANLILVTVEILTAVTNGQLQVNWVGGTAPSEGVSQVWKIAPGAGETVSFVAVDGTGSTGNASTYSAPTVSVTNGDIIFGAAAIETDDTITGDTDTTNGNWSAVVTRLHDAGADASTMSCASQHKTVNATGNQAWAATSSTARDSARTYIVLRSENAGFTATLSQTLGTLTASAAATVDVDATLSKTLGALASSANAAVDIAATFDKTFGAVTSSGAAEVTTPGDSSLSQTLGSLAISANAEVAVDATLSKALGTLTGAGNAAVAVDAALDKTLGTLTVSGAASVGSDATATLAQTLGTLTASGAATVTLDATLAKTLGVLSLSGAATVSLEAQLAKTLGALSLSANATVGEIVAAAAVARSQPIQSLGRLNARM